MNWNADSPCPGSCMHQSAQPQTGDQLIAIAGATAKEKLLLVGCGILENEIRHLIRKNFWSMDTLLLDSRLHCELQKLSNSLRGTLVKNRDRRILVFYGCCHPEMDQMLVNEKACRTVGLNCIEMLLGAARFNEELGKGAFFLLEDWASSWGSVLRKSLGTDNLSVIRDIFRCNTKYLLCIRTPCSRDFTDDAEAAGRLVDLPVRWIDVSLVHLESTLADLLDRTLREDL